MLLSLLDDQTVAGAGDWVYLPRPCNDAILTLTGEGGADLSGSVEVEDANGHIHSLHDFSFSEDGNQELEMGDLPWGKIRINTPTLTAGQLSSGLAFNN